MENASKIKTIIILLTCIFLFEIVMLCIMLRPHSFFLWATIGIIMIVNLYLVSISLSLLKLLNKNNRHTTP